MKNYFKTVYNKCHNLLTNYKGKSLNPIKPVYNKCHDFLATHKGLALFLSHGGLHIVMLILLLAILILMIDKLNRMDNADTEIFKFELRHGNFASSGASNGYELQNFVADFEFYRGKDYINDNKYSNIKFAILTAYRPRIHRDSLLENLELLKAICSENFQASIAIQTKPKVNYRGIMFIDSAVFFSKKGDNNIIFNPYRKDHHPGAFDASGRIDKVQLYQSKDLKDNELSWVEYMCDRKRTSDADFIRVSDTFSYAKPLESPYFSVYIRFSSRSELLKVNTDTSYTSYGTNCIKLSFPSRAVGMINSPQILHPISFKTIQPTPSKVGLDYIVYDDVETINEILHSGIYVAAEDVDGARKVSKLSFIYSVLLGTLIAFMLDILIHLILKWRKLSTTVSKATEYRDKK